MVSFALRVCLFSVVVVKLGAQQPEAKPRAESMPGIVVHLDRPTHRISPHLYGVFFEEINHAGEGGLWAQLLRNPTFEEPGRELDPLPGWAVTNEDRSLRSQALPQPPEKG